MGGSKVAMTFFLVSLVLFGSTVYWVSRVDNNKADQALKKAADTDTLVSAVDTHLTEYKTVVDERFKQNDEAFKKLMDLLLARESKEAKKMIDDLEWLKMRSQNQHHAAPQRIVLAQDKPLEFTVRYRQVAARPKTVAAGKPPEVDRATKKVIKQVADKMKGLSQ